MNKKVKTTMTPNESLHYAIGELAYSVARADGQVQKQEREKFQHIVDAELRCKDYDFDVSDTIFKILDRDRSSTKDTYTWAMNQIKLNSHYLSPKLKDTFIKVMEKVAKAYKSVTVDEMDILEKFKKDIAPIHGDPVYYQKN